MPRLEEHLDRDLVASMRTAFLVTMSCDIPSTMRRFIALILFLIWPEVANGGQVSSAYTTFDVNKCKQIEPEAEITAGAWICKGYKGLNIYVGGLDLRMQLAYGKNAASRCSVNQSFNKFNDVEPTIEWRIENGKALAAIERWHVSDGGYLPVSGVSSEQTYGSTVYDKGADVIHTLRHYMEAVFPKTNKHALMSWPKHLTSRSNDGSRSGT